MLVDISRRQIYDSNPDRRIDGLNSLAIAEPIMKRRKFAIAAFVSVAAIVGCNAMSSRQERGDERLPLRIIYAGNAGTSYTAAWEEFLKKHVASVRVVAAATLTRDDLREADVLIVDGEVKEPLFGGPLVIESIRLGLDDLQGFPVVLMGGAGALLASSLHLKPSWG